MGLFLIQNFFNWLMTTKQLDRIIKHYKMEAVQAHHDNDTYTRNRMIAIVHDLEDNYEDYLEYDYEEGDDYLETFFDIVKPKAAPSFLMFESHDPYSLVDTFDVYDWEDEYYAEVEEEMEDEDEYDGEDDDNYDGEDDEFL